MAKVAETCLVSYGQKSSCSGIIFNDKHGFIVTHATVVMPFLIDHPSLWNILQNGAVLNHRHFKNCNIDVLLECETEKQEHFQIGRNHATSLFNVTPSVDTATVNIQAKVFLVWKVEKFCKILTKLFPKADNWTFYDKQKHQQNQKDDDESENIAFLLPYFVLLKVKKLQQSFVCDSWKWLPSSQLAVGKQVYAVGTPFGNLSPPIFLNSKSKGIICNTTGQDKCLILTDARCIPGCEGGALYTTLGPKK